MSECISELPSNCIFNKGITGSGGTTLELKSNRNSIICVPNISLVLNKQSKDVFGVYGKTSNGDIKDYLNSDTKYKKFIVVYDSLPRLIDIIGELVYNDYFLLIDEYHILFNSYVFRNKAVRNILSSFRFFKNFCFMTATPLEEEFLLEELKDIPVVEAVWNNITTVKVQSVRCKSKVKETVAQLIMNFKDGECKENAYFFVNSVGYITDLVKIQDPVAKFS